MRTFITLSDITLETEGDALVHQVLLVNAVDVPDVCFRACFHIKYAEETATSSASPEESAGAFCYFVINFVSLKPTGVLIPSESFPIKG
jgi:hypothetical protein